MEVIVRYNNSQVGVCCDVYHVIRLLYSYLESPKKSGLRTSDCLELIFHRLSICIPILSQRATCSGEIQKTNSRHALFIDVS